MGAPRRPNAPENAAPRLRFLPCPADTRVCNGNGRIHETPASAVVVPALGGRGVPPDPCARAAVQLQDLWPGRRIERAGHPVAAGGSDRFPLGRHRERALPLRRVAVRPFWPRRGVAGRLGLGVARVRRWEPVGQHVGGARAAQRGAVRAHRRRRARLRGQTLRDLRRVGTALRQHGARADGRHAGTVRIGDALRSHPRRRESAQGRGVRRSPRRGWLALVRLRPSGVPTPGGVAQRPRTAGGGARGSLDRDPHRSGRHGLDREPEPGPHPLPGGVALRRPGRGSSTSQSGAEHRHGLAGARARHDGSGIGPIHRGTLGTDRRGAGARLRYRVLDGHRPRRLALDRNPGRRTGALARLRRVGHLDEERGTSQRPCLGHRPRPFRTPVAGNAAGTGGTRKGWAAATHLDPEGGPAERPHRIARHPEGRGGLDRQLPGRRGTARSADRRDQDVRRGIRPER